MNIITNNNMSLHGNHLKPSSSQTLKSVVLGFFILSGVAVANAQTPFNIQGTWIVDFVATTEHMASAEKERYEKMPTKSKDNMTRVFANRTYQFVADGSLIIAYESSNGPKSYQGNWAFDPSDNKLTITIQSSRSEFTVVQEGGNAIGLIYRNAPSQGMLKLLYLNRKS